MGKSYDEQIKELQDKISTLKKQRKEQKKKRALELGEAFFRLVPDAEAKFDEESFNIEDYLKDKLGIIEETAETNFVAEEEEVKPVQQTAPTNYSANAGTNNFQNGNY